MKIKVVISYLRIQITIYFCVNNIVNPIKSKICDLLHMICNKCYQYK